MGSLFTCLWRSRRQGHGFLACDDAWAPGELIPAAAAGAPQDNVFACESGEHLASGESGAQDWGGGGPWRS